MVRFVTTRCDGAIISLIDSAVLQESGSRAIFLYFVRFVESSDVKIP